MKFLKHLNSFSLSDYSKFDKENRKVFLIENQNCEVILELFFNRVLNIIKEKKHFPIIRLADGEYQFLLGTNELNLRKPKIKLVYHMFKQYYEKLFNKRFEAKSRTYTSGRYDINKSKLDIIEKYSISLQNISKKGVLAIYTIIKPGFYSEQYLPKLERFFEKNNIQINTKNYVPFYFVYILLTNKKYISLYENKNIHLITSYDESRKIKIEKTLKLLNVKKITWTMISVDNSLNDIIDVNKLNINIDIIFIGGGLGKVNIFNQLNDFPALIIDAGYIFETWQNPKLKMERNYCESHD
tara:strand:+ start:1116 stop:2009 length:894 start_codon:yes stop_codon:yes gene_type:complete